MPAESLREDLSALGFTTTSVHIWDYIPFPHIIFVARKP
jgi:hypothetical protein